MSVSETSFRMTGAMRWAHQQGFPLVLQVEWRKERTEYHGDGIPTFSNVTEWRDVPVVDVDSVNKTNTEEKR